MQGLGLFDDVGNWGGWFSVMGWPFVSEQQNLSSPVVSSKPQYSGGPSSLLKSIQGLNNLMNFVWNILIIQYE